jgi:osmotically-inducible protein OsmY
MKKASKILIASVISSGAILLSGCAAPLIAAGAGAAVVGANVAGNNAGAKTQLSDTQIKFRAVGFQADYPELKNNSNVEITVYNHIVLMLGQVPTEEIKVGLAKKIADLPGVIVVYNQLKVGPTIGIGQFSHDSWLTTKVVSSFLTNGISSLKFKVVTEHGIVYLMGVVTKEEGHEAAVVASKISGVQKVVQVFSYIPAKIQDNEKQADQSGSNDQASQVETSQIETPTIENQSDLNAIGPSA